MYSSNNGSLFLPRDNSTASIMLVEDSKRQIGFALMDNITLCDNNLRMTSSENIYVKVTLYIYLLR